MTKPEIVEELAKRLTFQKKQAEQILDTVIAVLTDAIKRGEKTNLSTLGVFSVRDVAARMARNPKTGAQISVPAHKKVKFKVSSALSDVVAGKVAA